VAASAFLGRRRKAALIGNRRPLQQKSISIRSPNGWRDFVMRWDRLAMLFVAGLRAW